MAFTHHHRSRKPRRGKMAKIQLIDGEDDTELLTSEFRHRNGRMPSPPYASGEPTQEGNTVEYSSPFPTSGILRTGPPEGSAQIPPSSPPFKAFVEKMVATPVVSYLSCNGGPRNPDGGDEEITSRPPWWRWWFGYARLEQAMKKGAPKIVVQTMKQFPLQARVQCIGCGALRDMALDSWPRKQEVVEAGSIDVILKAMRLHASDAKVQELACRCFYELVAGEIADLLVQKGVVASVLGAMEAEK